MRQYDDPPSEIFHPAHPAHDLNLVTTATAGDATTTTFVCDGCKEPGAGARYTCSCESGVSFDLHPPCALADEDELLRHPLFPGSDFFFLPEPPAPVDKTICDACGEPAQGYVYHCFEDDLDLHPCCARLPERILHDGRVFHLRRKTSRGCGLCAGGNSGGDGGRRGDFWAYRSSFDGEAVDLHVACMKDVARLSWEAADMNRDICGGGQIVQASLPNIEHTLQSLRRGGKRTSGFDKFLKVVSTVASIIIAVIFGNPVAMIAAIAGPGGLLQG